MRAYMQLTTDGREVPHSVVALVSSQSSRPLTPAQREIIAVVREKGYIRTVEAGVILHAHRKSCGFGARSGGHTGRGIACCPYAGPDGLAAMNRLMHRGLVYRDEANRGRWLAL